MSTNAFRFSVVSSVSRLSKSYTLSPQGDLEKAGGGALSKGTLDVFCADGLEHFAATVNTLGSHQAIILGTPKNGLEHAEILTDATLHFRQSTLGEPLEHTLSRTKKYLGWNDGPGLLLLDHDDDDGMTPEDVWGELTQKIPEMRDAGAIAIPSSSYGIFRKSDNTLLTHTNKFHIYTILKRHSDAEKIKRLIEVKRLGYYEKRVKMNSRTGVAAVLRGHIVDTTTFSSERLDYAGCVVLGDGLYRNAPAPRRIAAGGMVEPIEGGGFFVPEYTPKLYSVLRTEIPVSELTDTPVTETESASADDSNISPEEKEPPLTSSHGTPGNLTAIWQRRRNQRLSAREVERVKHMLSHIPSATGAIKQNGYQIWIAICAALRNYGKQGLAIWLEWSMSQEPHDSKSQLIKKFYSFSPDGGITLGTLVFHAKNFGWCPEPERSPQEPLSPIAATLPLAVARATLQMAVVDFVREKKPVRLGVWASTGTGKSYSIKAISDTLKEIYTGTDRPTKVLVEAVDQRDGASRLADELRGLGLSVAIRFGSEEIDTETLADVYDGDIHRAFAQTPNACRTPQRDHLNQQLRGENHYLAESGYCYGPCEIGDNRLRRLAAEKGKSALPVNPAFPSRCYRDYAQERREESADVLIVVGNAVPADWESAAMIIRDEEGELCHLQSANADDILKAKQRCQELLDAGAQAARITVGVPFTVHTDNDLGVLRAGCIWLASLYAALGNGEAVPTPPATLCTYPGQSFPWEKVQIDQRAVTEIPRRFAGDLVKNFGSAEIVEGKMCWSVPAPSLHSGKPQIVFSATPTAVARAYVDREVEILVAQNIDIFQDASGHLGQGTQDKQDRAVALAMALDQEDAAPPTRKVFARKDSAETYAAKAGLTFEDSQSLLLAGVSYPAVGGKAHNQWIGNDIDVFGSTVAKPEKILVDQYLAHRLALKGRGIFLAPWEGGMHPIAGGHFVPTVEDAKNWLYDCEAGGFAQIAGRARAGAHEGAPLRMRIFGGYGVADRLRTQYGHKAQYHDDMIPDHLCGRTARAKVLDAANALAAKGEAITRASVEAVAHVAHDAYSWLWESAYAARFVHLLRDKGRAAQIKARLDELQTALGEMLQGVLEGLMSAVRTVADIDSIQGVSDEEALCFPLLRSLLSEIPPG